MQRSSVRLSYCQDVYDEVVSRLKRAYASVVKRTGDPLDEGTLFGPLHSKASVEAFKKTMEDVAKEGGKVG